MPTKNPFEPFSMAPPETLLSFIQKGYYYGAFIKLQYNSSFIPCWGYNDMHRSGAIPLDWSAFSYSVSDIPAISVFKDGVDLQSAWGPIDRARALEYPDKSFIKILKFSDIAFETLVDTYDVQSTKEELQTLFDICLRTTQIPLQDYERYFDDGNLYQELTTQY